MGDDSEPEALSVAVGEEAVDQVGFASARVASDDVDWNAWSRLGRWRGRWRGRLILF